MEAHAMSSSLGAMGSLLGKLHAQIVSPEIQLPKSLKGGIEHLTRDLEEINRSMVDLSRVEDPNAMVKCWMNEVRELSYDMEDYIDGTMSSNLASNHGMNSVVIKKFRTLVRQASQRHERYQLGRWASNPSYMVDAQGQVPSSFGAKATDLVGMSVSRCKLIKCLSNADEAQEGLKVVSVLGPAGVGKSTLAQQVYREIGGQFERRAFVRASRMPDTRRLLRSMISQVRRHQRPPCGLEVQELVKNLGTHLKQKRCFIIIDGLWETISWDIIKKAFLEGAPGSRILITTDIEEVALESKLDFDSHLDAQVGTFKMGPLSTDDSTELFFNIVFGSKPELSEQLKKYAEEIIRKCSGLPLAIIIIASVLAVQQYNSDLWHHITDFLYARNNLPPEDFLREVIGLGYNSLSQQLKTCLLYLSFYHEGHTFLKVDLVKQWTAEGFIAAVEGKHINEVAESNLDVLVSRGFVQPNINDSDELMFYTVHSTIFEFIKSKSIEENFATVVDYSETIPKLLAKVRRLSLSFSNAKYATKPDVFTLSPVRSITFYGFAKCLPSIMEFKLLRVLTLEFWGDQKEFDLSGIFILFHLRYVRITTDIVIKLPVSMQGLKYLETLEIYASLLTVPSDIVSLPKLLHLHLQGDIKLPDYVGQLKSLQTLQSFDLSSNSEDSVKSLGEMANLCDLHITCSTAPSTDRLKTNLIALASSIGKHESLKSLTLAPGVSCPSIFMDCSSIVSSPPVSLEKFELLPPVCIFSRLPEWIGQLQKLCVLKISVKELRRDDLHRIAGLQGLTILSLYVRQPTAEIIIFNRASFPFLKYLKLRCSVLHLAFQAEAIPNLRRLKLEFSAHSREQYSDILSGTEHLLNLQEIAVRIRVAPGAQESDWTVVESVLKDTNSKHSRHLRFNVRRADSIEEEQFPPVLDLATSSSHSDGLLYTPITVDVTSQSSEINVVPVPKVSPLNDDSVMNNLDIHSNQQEIKAKEGTQRNMVGMESAALFAAVSGTLKLVDNKLAPLVFKEYSSIVGVKKDLQELQDLAQEINSQLEAAGDRALYMGDAPSLRKLKEAVSEVEDAVDEFQLKAEKYEADGHGGFVSKYLYTKPKSFVFQCHAAEKIKKIKKMFDVLVKQRNILNSIVGNDPVSHTHNTVVSKQTLLFVDETEAIGRDQEMLHIISKLLEKDDQQRIKTVSIVGLGGSGKTTLAQLVFKKIETMENYNFTVKLWVHVSQETFQPGKILKKLFEAVFNERSEGLPLMSMANKILDMLTNKRFLLVLDDVWVEDCIKWQEFMVYLKNGSSGSRILLTTRSRNVARTVESTTVMDLPLLSKEYSWQVFQQSFGNAMKDLGSEFHEVGKEIVNKCGGVPLAIKVLAGVLRDMGQVEQWHAIKDNTLLDVDDKEHQVYACLRLSYFNLPSHLKQCFTICSLFPKGHWIDKDQLIDIWIAHDMVTEDGDYLEYVGDDYFNHLVQMYFIQDAEEADDGRVRCKMHDLVHDLARSILGDEISSVVPKKTTNFTNMYRYFSISEHTRHLPPENTFQNVRAMYIAEDDDFIFGKAWNAKYLRSIIVEHVHTSALTAILQTKNLRYLQISGLKYETLPEVISEVWSLQALHVTSSHIVKLPKSIGKLKKLRVVDLSNCRNLTSLPDSIGNCVMISSIDLFGCVKVRTLPSSISRNKRLRVLRLGYTSLERLPSSIVTLENLKCLDLQFCWNLVELPQGIGNLKKLVVLNLQGCSYLRAISKGIAQLTQLQTLGLFVMREDDENYAQISELENTNKISGELTIDGIGHCMDRPDVARKEWLKHKTNLQSLTLICARDGGVNSESQLEVMEPPPGIRNLKIILYSGQEFMQWMLKHSGAEVAGLLRFRQLSELELSNFPKLERLERLTELPCLEKLVLENMTALRSISGGPFPSLSRLYMARMPSLDVVWMATEGSLADLEGGQLQIGNRLSVLYILECPKLMVMPYFPSSLKSLSLVKSNMQLLGLPSQGQGSSLPSSSAGFPSFSFSHLKELYLVDMAPPAGATSYGAECRWELLQHLTALKYLEIEMCDGLTKLPESMRSLSSLRTLSIFNCSALFMLPEWLGELCYLETMRIYGCDNLSTPSMKPLMVLKALHIFDCWWVEDLCSPSLQTLQIECCRLPQSFRQLTSLTNLKISNCDDIGQLPECLGELRSLQKLHIMGLPRLYSLPQSFGHLTSLQELRIEYCHALSQLPHCVGKLHSLRVFKIWELPSLACLPQSLGHLTSLEELGIGKTLGQLPKSLGELPSLRKFEIWGLQGLTSIPELTGCLTSLEQLMICDCPGIRSLPEWIKGLTALQTLGIYDCPGLERHCERRTGKDWHLISHIPHLLIGKEDDFHRSI